MLAPPPEQWVLLPSPASCLLCCLLRIYHLCWVSIRLYFVSTVQSLLGCIAHRLHSVMCMCVLFWVCTNAIARYYVCLCCAALLPAQYAMYVLFVLHYWQRRVLCVSCLCRTTASAGCYICLVCVALLPVQCAAVEHCQRSVPPLNTASAVCVPRWTLPVQCVAVEHCQCSVPLLNTASAVSRVGATISPLFIFIFTLFIIFTHSH